MASTKTVFPNLVIPLFLLFISTFLEIIGVHGNILCIEEERVALLNIKKSLNDSPGCLSSWVGQDCCKWKGVGCNNITGHVVELDLHRYSICINGQLFLESLGGELSPSLINLKHLSYLDLSGNDFQGIPIPNFLGNLSMLHYLDLSDANFLGFSTSLINLKHLSYLDLSRNDFRGIPIPNFLGNLSMLHYLDLFDANFSGLSPSLINLKHFSHLDLSRNDFQGIPIPNFLGNLSMLQYLDLSDAKFSGLNPSLIDLKHLSYLDLSGNDFRGIPIPNFLGNLSMLHHLDLFDAKFSGIIPSQLGNLSNLHYLSLSDTLYVSDLSWLSGLTSLQYLHMNGVNMSKVSDKWLYNVNTIPSLLELYLSGCELGTSPQILPPVNFTSLSILDLSDNDFNSSIPLWLFNISSLVSLEVTHSKLRGPLPQVGWGNLCKLQSLNLADNELTGEVNEFITTLSSCNNKSLEELNLRSNHLSGHLPEHLGHFHYLKDLNVPLNSISGSIPLSIGNLSNLVTFVLYDNMMNGTIPESVGKLSKLWSLLLDGNSWEGTITNIHFQNLTNLAEFSILCAKHNLGFFNVTQDWTPPFNLFQVGIKDCQIGPKFPSWLETQNKLEVLLLKNVSISEPIPDWLWNLSPQIGHLDLSHNKIDGHLPRTMNFLNYSHVILAFNQLEGPVPLWYGVEYLNLKNNSLFGPIPTNYFQERTSLYSLDLSNNLLNGSIPSSITIQLQLEYLDLSYNQLTGEIPVNLMRMQSLDGIDLSHNNLSGGIPTSLCSIPSLKILQLSNNNLHQDLSSALQNCTGLTLLTTLDLGNNRFFGSIPQEIGKSLAMISVLRLRGNALTGNIPESLCNLPYLHLLDLAENNLCGIVPTCLGDVLGLKLRSNRFSYSYSTNLVLMGTSYYDYNEHIDLVLKGRQDEYFQLMELVNMIDLSKNHLSGIIPEKLTELQYLGTLNLSWNHLTGDIPRNMGSLRYLETLDLSHNHLSGPIPPSMSSMTLLSHLNLSYNNFCGQIPSTNQFLTFNDPSIYEGNPNLCGAPLSTCSSPNAGDANANEDEEKFEKFWFYVGMGFGFIVGFWAVFGSLVIKRSWRHAYFKFLDSIKNKLWG